MPGVRRFCGVALVVWAMVLGLGGCGETAGPPVNRSAPQVSAAGPAAPVDLASGPMATFEAACAICHGSHGNGYRGGFFRMSDKKMAREVREMMFEDAGLKPSEAEIQAMTAYHLALRDRRPFVCIVNAAAVAGGKAGELKGEATPGSAVRIEKDGMATDAVVDRFTWRVPSPPPPPFKVMVEQRGVNESFEFPARCWSD